MGENEKQQTDEQNNEASALNGWLNGKCGCGKPASYMIKGTEGACNKYMRCPTYEDMREMIGQANSEIRRLRKALENIAEWEGATATGAQAEKALSETAI